MNSERVILLTLHTFSITGGIQKMTRTLAHSLHKITQQRGAQFELWSAYDRDSDLLQDYLPAKQFRGFASRRLRLIWHTVRSAPKTDRMILGHINLGIVGLMVKTINPSCRLWLVAHGIEVWRPVSRVQRILLKRCDRIICVSAFTRQEVIRTHGVPPERCSVLNNAVDPFMRLPDSFDRPAYLMERYELSPQDTVIYSLTRMSASEKYKGYDQVLQVLGALTARFPRLKYILAGPYDQAELRRVQGLIQHHNLEPYVILTGLLDEQELADHFLLADVFVLPSKKEGFGIVYIEAMACGTPVICGNVDGSLDAIRHGELGQAIDPDDLSALTNALTTRLEQPKHPSDRKHLQKDCLRYFDEQHYIHNLQQIISQDAK